MVYNIYNIYIYIYIYYIFFVFDKCKGSHACSSSTLVNKDREIASDFTLCCEIFLIHTYTG